MDPATVNQTIFYRNATDFIATWAENSDMRKLWDKYPDKQSWMSNKNYTIEPVDDKFE